MNADDAKQRLRVELRRRVAAMSPGECAAASAAVREHLAASEVWDRSAVILLYAADASEPDLDALITLARAQGRVVCLPRVHWDTKTMTPAAVRGPEDLRLGRHGIRVPTETCEAIPPESVSLIVVPGIGFDLTGHRVGRGGGFYDRFLAGRTALGSIRVGSSGAVTLGACFAAQVVAGVPVGTHDQRVDGLVTETGLAMVARNMEGPR